MDLKEKIAISIAETIYDIDRNKDTINSITNFILDLDNRPLHSINGRESLESIREFILGEDQNIYIDFLILLKTKLYINNVSDDEIIDYLDSIISIYPKKFNNDLNVLSPEYKNVAVTGSYKELDPIYSLVTLLRLNTSIILPALSNENITHPSLVKDQVKDNINKMMRGLT